MVTYSDDGGASFDAYVKQNLGARSFSFSSSAGWWARLSPLLTEYHSLAQSIGMPANLRGDPWKVTFGFYAAGASGHTDESEPFAQSGLYDGRHIVALSRSLVTHFDTLARQLLSSETFLPFIGNPKRGSIAPLHKDRLGFVPLITPNYEDQFALQAFLGAPVCPKRQAFSTVFSDLMVRMVLDHELAHALHGHILLLGQLGARPHLGAWSKRDREIDLPGQLLLALEYEADKNTANAAMAKLTAGQLQRSFDGLTSQEWIVVCLMAAALVGHTWRMCELRAGTERALSEKWTGYPPARLRASLMLVPIVNFVQDFGAALGIQTIMPMIDAVTGQFRDLAEEFPSLRELNEIAVSSDDVRDEVLEIEDALNHVRVAARPFQFLPTL